MLRQGLDFAVYLFVRVLIALVQAVPLSICERGAEVLATLAARVLRIRQHVVDENLRIAFPEAHRARAGRHRLADVAASVPDVCRDRPHAAERPHRQSGAETVGDGHLGERGVDAARTAPARARRPGPAPGRSRGRAGPHRGRRTRTRRTTARRSWRPPAPSAGRRPRSARRRCDPRRRRRRRATAPGSRGRRCRRPRTAAGPRARSTAASTGSSERPESTTRAPSATRHLGRGAAEPRAPPVTMKTRSFSSRSMARP